MYTDTSCNMILAYQDKMDMTNTRVVEVFTVPVVVEKIYE